MQTVITLAELELLVEALETREFQYGKIQDIHRYLLDKIDECVNIEDAKTRSLITPTHRSDHEPTKKGHITLVPPSDLFSQE